MIKSNVAGIVLVFNGREVIVPGLSLSQVRQNRPLLSSFIEAEKLAAENPDSALDSFSTITTVVQLALSRNYPDVTEAEVENSLDLNNVKEWVAAVMGQSGFRVTREIPSVGEGAESGEAGKGGSGP